MKQLLIGVFLLLLVGIGAFLYRNAKEKPVIPAPGQRGQVACTLEAKVCPDGTSIGRTGPRCEFAACSAPNVDDTGLGIAYAVPTGFTANAAAIGSDLTLHAVYDSSAGTTTPDSLVIRDYLIPVGKTGTDVILANTVHESSGMPAKSMKEFAPIITGGKTYQSITVERF
jgi:hypothetical protein